MSFVAKRKIKFAWCENLAYAIGLLTSNGCLNKDKRHIWFSSKDLEMVMNLKQSLELNNKIGKYARGGEKEKKYYYISFGDINFYKFLESIGLSPKKSKTVRLAEIPNQYFSHFIRGLFDGGGSFYTYWDKRWPNSFGYKLSFASASIEFINWLREKLKNLYGTKGYFHKGAGVINLEYVKGDSKKLFEVMYNKTDLLCLKRKYNKIKNALDKDRKFGLHFLQKQRNAVVA